MDPLKSVLDRSWRPLGRLLIDIDAQRGVEREVWGGPAADAASVLPWSEADFGPGAWVCHFTRKFTQAFSQEPTV